MYLWVNVCAVFTHAGERIARGQSNIADALFFPLLSHLYTITSATNVDINHMML